MRAQLISVMAAGAKNRAVAATGMNQGSSRSHSVFIISVQQVRCCIEPFLRLDLMEGTNGAKSILKGFQYLFNGFYFCNVSCLVPFRFLFILLLVCSPIWSVRACTYVFIAFCFSCRRIGPE